MEDMKIKKFVAEKLHEGVKLTDIQTLLVEELDCKMTFLELRLLAAELEDVDWSQFDPQEKKAPEVAPAAPAAEPAGELEDAMPEEPATQDEVPAPAAGGETVVELSRLSRPGALAHGTVTFASGVTGEWLIDEMGRLGLDKVSGQPTQEDIEGFQNELRKLFERR